MLAYSDSYFDNLPDNTLKALQVIAQILLSSKLNDVEQMQLIIDKMSLLTLNELLHFFAQVLEAMERRYGPVPGY